MEGQFGYKVWLPVVVTLGVLIGLIFVIDALVSRMWADLIGLFYLMASPFIYRGLKSIVGVDTHERETNIDRSQMRKVGE